MGTDTPVLDRPEQQVSLAAGEVVLEGTLALPRGCHGVVLFAHGSGSGRQSPRNRLVAGVLAEAGLSTLLVDLLAPEEQRGDATELQVVPGAGHLFEEPGALERVAELAREWFERHLR